MDVHAPGVRAGVSSIVMAGLLLVSATSLRASVPAELPVVWAGPRTPVVPSSAGMPRAAQPRARATEPAAPSEPPRPWWGWLLLGRLHPVAVHFPIALLTVAAAIEGLHLLGRRPVPSEAGTYCLAFGVVGAMASVWLGTLNAGHQSVTGEAAVALERHQVMGWISMMAATAALGAGQFARRAAQARHVAVYAGLVLATSAVVGATGHMGGGLVYGEDYLSGVLPWNQKAEPAPTEAPAAVTTPAATPPAATMQAGAPDFAREVMPIFKRTCVECHGPDKVKARLRMDSVEALQKGGKSGALLKPGDPENSLLLRRVLGLDGEDQMPLDQDPLTEKQIDTLRRWIAAGAVYPGAGSQ